MADLELVEQAEAARRLGVSHQAIGQWVRKPEAPTEYRGGKLFLRWPDFPQWWVASRVAGARRSITPSSLDDARTRREAAMAELAELDLAERRGELVTVADYQTELAAICTRIRSRLVALPGKWAPRLAAVSSTAEAQGQLEAGMYDVLTELRGLGDDDDADATAD